MPSKVITDTDPDTGTKTREGIGATVGQDIADAAERTNAFQQSTFGSPAGITGKVSGATIGTKAGSGIGVPTTGTAASHTDSIRGQFRFTSGFLTRMVPRYNAMVDRHNAAKAAVMAPLENQLKVVQALRAKMADKTGFWAAVTDFLSDPVSLLSLAGVAVSGGAGSALAAKQALSGWSKEQGAEEAVARLDKATAALQRELALKNAHLRSYTPFTVDGLALDMATGDPATIPKGAVLFSSSTGSNTRGIIGTGPLPKDFIDWFKRKHKPLGKLLTPHIGTL